MAQKAWRFEIFYINLQEIASGSDSILKLLFIFATNNY
jgi:hypothetical protein